MARSLIILFAACLLAACAARPRTETAPAPRDLIEVQVYADYKLNLFKRTSHALHVCLYQLKDQGSFAKLARNKGGFNRLLECGRFDESVAGVGQLVVQPGDEIKLELPRAAEARFLGIATGYYYRNRKKVSEVATLSGKGGPAALQIELGPREIRSVRVE